MAGKEFHLSFRGESGAEGVGREEDGFALADLDGVAVAVRDCSLAVDADGDEEGIEAGYVLGYALREVKERGCEVFAAYQGVLAVSDLRVVGPVVVKDGVVDGVFCQFRLPAYV